jgi:gluconokinase
MVLILMGVCGSGKTTIGEMLCRRLGWQFADGDDYHPESNRRKMAAGVPLDDSDRMPWLDNLHAQIQQWAEHGRNTILACSALKESYRQRLQGNLGPQQVRFVLLDAPREVLADRLAHRSHAYMNPALLDSQLATLDAPRDAWRISVAGTPQETCADILAHLHASPEW